MRERVLAAAHRRDFARGQVVFHEGEPGDSLHLLAAGRMAVRVSTESGESATLRILQPGEVFGELALVRRGGQHRRSATVAALEPATTFALSRPVFDSLTSHHPEVERLVVSLLADRVDQLSHRLLEALYVGVDRRVFRRLVELLDIYGGRGIAAVIPLTQEDLAGLAGATRPTVNQVLQRLAAEGVVELRRGSIRVLDAKELRRRAGS